MLTGAAKLFGVVFLFIGILGFIPGATTDGHMLLGIFHINTLHNIIHMASGAVALIAGFSGASGSQMYFKIFGVIYTLVAVLGIFYGDNPILGLVANNAADVVLHFVIAAAALYLGFGIKKAVTT